MVAMPDPLSDPLPDPSPGPMPGRTHEQAPHPAELALLREAALRLVRTVDALADRDWDAPSLLPGWSRAHVVAHLVLNAEGLAGCLGGVAAGEAVPMYPSQARRDGDIEELAAAGDRAELRDRLLASTTDLADAVAAVPQGAWGASVERVPGGPRTFAAGDVPGMRLRELEIHHADLGAGYSPADWLDGVAVRVLDAMTARGVSAEPFRTVPTDAEGTWTFGDGGPTVSGAASDLAWWLTGRGDGAGLTSDDGELPRIGAW
jgi:maleylpyruvate isomerase